MRVLCTGFPRLFGTEAIAIWPLVLIVPERAKDKALIAHEQVHLDEQARTLVLPWWVAYLCSKRFRLSAEVRAYRAQIALGGITPERAATALSTLYQLGITREQALAALA